MNINKIIIENFGNFERKCISTNENFTVVYGQNETGKSTTLRAIKQALYKFKSRNNKDFYSFPKKNAKISLEIFHNDKKLSFSRKPGNKNTLFDMDDNLIDEIILIPFLQNISEDNFSTMFGLNHEILREGGTSLLFQSNGTALLETTGSILPFIKAIKQINLKMEKINKPKGRNQKIPKLINEIKENKKEIENNIIPFDVYNEKIKVVNKLKKERVDEFEKDKKLSQELKIIEDSKIYFKNIKELEEIKNKIENFNIKTKIKRKELYDISLLNKEIIQLNKDIEENKNKKNNIQKKIESLTKEYKFKNKKREIDFIVQNYQSIEEKKRQLENNNNKINSKKKNIELLKKELPEELNEEELKKNDYEIFEKIKNFKSKINDINNKIKISNNDIEKNNKKIENFKKEIDFLNSEIKNRTLNENKNIVENYFEEIQKLETKSDLLEKQKKECYNWIYENDDLKNKKLKHIYEISISDLENIKENDFKLSETLKNIKNNLEKTKNEIKQIEEKINLERFARVPTIEDYKMLLEKRNEILDKIIHDENVKKADWFNFSKYLLESDRIAEDLYRNSKDSLEKENLKKLMENKKTQIKNLFDEQNDIKQKIKINNEHWNSFWADTNIKESSNFKFMIDWKREFDGKYKKNKEFDNQIYEITNEKNFFIDKIENIINESIRENAILKIKSFLDEQNKIEIQINKINDKKNSINSLEDEITSCKKQMAEDKKEITSIYPKMDYLLLIFDSKTKKNIIEKNETCQKIKLILDDVDSLKDEINNYKAKIENFENNLSNLIDALKINKNEYKNNIIDFLKMSLDDDNENYEKYKNNSERLTEIENNLDKNKNKNKILNKKYKDFFKLKNIDIPENFERWEKDASLFIDLYAKREMLEKNINEIPNSKKIIELKNINMDEKEKEIKRKIEIVNKNKSEIEQNYGIYNKEIEEINNTNLNKLFDLNLDITALKDDLAYETKNYLIYAFIMKSMKKFVEEYRKKNQFELIKNISYIFNKLTNSNYKKLIIEYDDKDDPFYVVINKDDKRVDIKDLSEGTRDQLYLSIRLAGINLIRKKGVSFPIILDDLLINFDDKRTMLALKLLKEISEENQIIYFTHQSNVLEFAGNLNLKIEKL